MTPNRLTAAWVKWQYTFVLELDYPLTSSLLAIAKFLAGRKIQIEYITIGEGDKNQMTMVLKCHLEKDRVKHTMKLMAMVPGVLKLELAPGK